MEARRHALPGRARVHMGQCAPGFRPPAGIYATDHADPRQSGHLRWLLSTCLAAVAGQAGGVGGHDADRAGTVVAPRWADQAAKSRQSEA